MIDVAVAGSLHLDIMVKAPRLPMRDETMMGSSWHYKCGGKGGNQAVAAARFGGRVGFGGRTGADDFGDRLRANLAEAGVDIACVGIDPTTGSGMSVAIEEESGEYGAVVVSGANLAIDAGTIAKNWKTLWSCKVLLLQNEIPEPVNLAAAREAKGNGARIVVNAAPARAMSSELLDLVDVLVVNRVEAAMLSGHDDAEQALKALCHPARDVILTRGRDGLMLATRDGTRDSIPAMQVMPVSTHGAGDCFCGALAARLAVGDAIQAACKYANVAAGLFVSTPEGGWASITDANVRQHGG